MGDWHERDHRYSVDWPVTVGKPDASVDTRTEGRIFNISTTGLSVMSRQPYLTGTRLKIEVQVPDDIAEKILLPNPVPIHVEVMWCKELLHANQIGGKFLYLSPLVNRLIHDAFKAFSDGMVKKSET